MATIRKRGQYQWQAIIRRKGHPQQSKTFETRKDAEAWARKIEREMDTGAWRDTRESESTTLHVCLERYLNEVSIHKKGHREEINKARVIARHPIASKFIGNIRGSDIAQYRDIRINEGKAASTIQKELALLSHLFNTARKEWGMETLQNPVQLVRKPKINNSRNRRLVDDEENRLLKACRESKNQWLEPAVILALETGQRKGRVLQMRWENIDFAKQIIYMPDKISDNKNAPDEIPLFPRAIELLAAIRKPEGPIIESSDNALKLAFIRACERAGIENLRFHDLRHEATSRLFERNLNMIEVAEVTGHKTLQMLKRYAHPKAENIVKKYINEDNIDEQNK